MSVHMVRYGSVDMAKKQVALALEEEFLGRVDAARGDVSRNRFIERALEAALLGRELREAGPATSWGQEAEEGPMEFAKAVVPPLDKPRSSIAVIEGRSARACEQCGKAVESPTLRRCMVCNGRIVPEPVLS